MPGVVVDGTRLTGFGARVLEAHGVPANDARLVSESLVAADSWGHPSHGMLRLEWYVARLRSGAMSAVTEVATLVDSGAIAVVDGQDGIGQVITNTACESAVARASAHGIGAVAVRNSNHFGTAAYWTRRMAEAGFIGILTTNGSPAMAPWGGKEKTVGANPWSIATPGGENGPLVLDIANTSVARGKIYAAKQRGEDIPADWAIDAQGRPTTDAQAAIEGILAPVGGHKGYGISFMMDVLSGVLTGSRFSTGVVGPYVPDERSGCGHLVIALDVSAFMGLDEFRARVAELIAQTKSVPRAAGVAEIFVPGEIEARAEERSRTVGVTLPQKTADDLARLARECGVTAPWEREAQTAC
ncbi:Malate/lactate/ureidoglycolate dehydrogenase, LDH2 family [Paramicrobacterium humi]|uniref:Malate/lactate/ureidoglycolate dehydrogenase, LDH2 family n=1 Tax=Paramicrobacterium humi TaxID=640635 RepID=A0A1H4LD62_9MICO|nr:Ldh family oxidoreductase [Microbacterium humi]SEB68152.1 Malate/lactate/ureidoglycolate dehydrogenase, LDH2 family [Microbacterium humi]